MATNSPTTTTEESPEAEFNYLCDNLRKDLLCISKRVRQLLEHSDLTGLQKYRGQYSEMKANIMLSYRHLEDARMRIGKVLQAAGDGVSILDK